MSLRRRPRAPASTSIKYAVGLCKPITLCETIKRLTTWTCLMPVSINQIARKRTSTLLHFNASSTDLVRFCIRGSVFLIMVNRYKNETNQGSYFFGFTLNHTKYQTEHILTLCKLVPAVNKY